VDVGLGTLDVVVQVVPEQMDQVDCVVSSLLLRVPGKEHEGDVADSLSSPGVCIFKAKRRVFAEQNLRCCRRSASSLLEFLQENLHEIQMSFDSNNEQFELAFPKTMSSSSLKMVENTTVTRSALASTYMVSSSLQFKNEFGQQNCSEHIDFSSQTCNE
jgi:hypothetical protein